MKRALISKNKFKFIDETIEIPNIRDPNYEAWDQCNNLIHSWILGSLSPSIAHNVIYIENAIEVWNDLKERFSQGDLIRIAKLQQELHNLRQGTLNVSEYFTELKSLWEELEYYRPTPQCTCLVTCMCITIRKSKLYRQQDNIIHFLMGFNDSFEV
uniref:Uncharacterized protein n=1 Tax=Cajanus cajan TaxID=3821 RepID=A0A151SNZ2_CAJCA|nr:hypothetical protein KK1_002778 [Cajanus cajan]